MLILPTKLVTTKGLITFDGSWIEVKYKLIEKLSSLKILGVTYISNKFTYEEYPISQSFEKRLAKAKEICKYAQIFAIALNLEENDEKLNSIGFPCDAELEILFNEDPIWDELLIEFYEESAHSLKLYLESNPKDKYIVEKAWKKAGLNGLENMPLSKVTKEELELDKVYKFLSCILSEIDPISFQGSVNFYGSSSLYDYLLLIKKEAYFSYKRNLYNIYEVLAAMIATWNGYKIEQANKALIANGCPSIPEMLKIDNFFKESYLNLPHIKLFKLPGPQKSKGAT